MCHRKHSKLAEDCATADPDFDDDAGTGINAQATEVVDAAPEVEPQITAEAALPVSPKPVD